MRADGIKVIKTKLKTLKSMNTNTLRAISKCGNGLIGSSLKDDTERRVRRTFKPWVMGGGRLHLNMRLKRHG